MTLREKIADVISGGAITKRDAKIHELQQMCGSWRINASDESGRARRAEREYFRLRGTIHAIIALETPNMAHVGKKAVKLAKEGLGE